ncbi:MAG: 6-phosphofructokinase [Putridiphycobacter sp.]
MTTNVRNIAVFTSGGDAPGMNACIRAVVRAGIFHDFNVYGVVDGFNGLIDDHFEPMAYTSVSNIISKGGTILGTERSPRFREKSFREIAFNNIKKRNIDTIVVIGGDGSYKGVKVFSEEFGINFIGIPGTIDNDIFGSNYSIGFDTALNNSIEAIDKIRDTASSHHRIFLVEVMGNRSGVLALNTAIATGAEDVFIPERDEDLNIFEEKIKKAYEFKKSSIIVVSEGDQIGGAKDLYNYLEEKGMAEKVRVAILGHIQRGGAPTYKDRMLATQFGAKAVDMIMAGDVNKLIGTNAGEIFSYEFTETVTKQLPSNYDALKLIKKLSRY